MSVIYDDEVMYIQMNDDSVSDNDFKKDYDESSSMPQTQSQKGGYPWGLVLGMIAIAVVGIFVFTRIGNGGTEGSDLDGDYYLYRNTVFHQVDGVIEIENGEFKKSFAQMLLDSGKYEYDDEDEVLRLGNLEFKVIKEDGEVKALDRIFEGGIHNESEIYYKQ